MTGSSSEIGIGFASARLLGGQLGAAVMVTGTTDRVHQRAQELAAEASAPRRTSPTCSTPPMRRALVEATEAAFGKLDILVNNAGLASVHSPRRTELTGGDDR